MEGASDRIWHYVAGSEKKGPHTVRELIDLARANTIAPNTLVWSEGMTGWEPLETLPVGAQIAAQLAPASPPPFRTQANQADLNQHPDSGYSSSPSVGFVEAIQLAFKKYFDFSTRIGRSEFWYFVLFSVVGGLVTTFIDMAVFGVSFDEFSPLNSIFTLALIIPSLSAAARRLHDTDRSGWWQLIGIVPLIGIIVLIVFWCSKGTRGRNRFG